MTKDKNYMGKKFEFLLLINGNIICQRYFMVKDFNPESLQSYDLKYCVDRCVETITGDDSTMTIPNPATLKGKTWEYLWSGYNPYLDEYPPFEPKNNYENEDIFTFQIKIDGKCVIEKWFSGNDYPPKVRYDVNIRALIPEVITIIQDTLTEKNLSMVSE